MRDNFDRDLTEELRDHIERRTADHIRAGMTPHEARRKAHIEFGAVEAYKEEVRDGQRWAVVRNLPGQLGQELVFALRRLRATPLFALFAVVSLAVGIGVTTAFYSVMYAVLWPASGVTDPHALVYVVVPRPGKIRTGDWAFTTTRGDFEELHRLLHAIDGLAAWTSFAAPFIDGPIAQPMRGEAVTGGLFDTLRVRMARGRPIVPADDEPGAQAVAVIEHAFWKTTLGGDPAVVGRTVRIGGQPMVIVGVTPPGFHGITQPFLAGGPQLWLPVSVAARISSFVRPAADLSNHRAEWLSVVGRLRPGASVEQARTEVGAIGRQLDKAFPLTVHAIRQNEPDGSAPRKWSAVRVDEAIGTATRDNVRMGFAMVGLVALVLVVACTNLANLMLARGSARQHEFAVRRALGCSRARLIRELIVESSVLALAGGAAGVLVARGVLLAIAAATPVGVGFTVETALMPGVLAASFGGMVLTLLVFGLWPAWQLSRADARGTLAKDGATMGATRWRTRRGLIAAQVAVSAGFFLVAAMCVRTVAVGAVRDTGVDLDRLAVSSVSFQLLEWDDARIRATVERVLDLARTEPAVEAISASDGLPFGLSTAQVEIAPPDRPFPPGREGTEWTYLVGATPELFRVLGVPITRGRPFDQRDAAGAPPAAVVSARTARRLFGDADAVGRQILMREVTGPGATRGEPATSVTALTVVGIARDTDVGTIGREDATRNLVYVPLAQRPARNVVFVVRSTTDPVAMTTALRTLLRRADPDLVAGASGPGAVILDGFGTTIRMLTGMASGLGALVLVLAMTGLFGVLSHLVARRTREFGVRVAVGATRRNLIGLVLGDGLRPVLYGLTAGLFLGSLGRLIFRALERPHMDAVDPLALVLTPLPMILAAFAACYLPARRASRVDPNVALRDL